MISVSDAIAIVQSQTGHLGTDIVELVSAVGRILAEERNFQQISTYFPTLGEGQFVGNQQAIEKLAAAIVERLQAEW